MLTSLKLDRPLSPSRQEYLKALANTKRVERDVDVLKYYADPVRAAVELPLGEQGEYFVGNDGTDDGDKSIDDSEYPPGDQPSQWCSWVPSEDGTELVESDNAEGEDEHAVEWLRYIVKNFLVPWGHTVNGHFEYTDDENKTVRVNVSNNFVQLVGGEEESDSGCCGGGCHSGSVPDGRFTVLDQKWTMLVQLRNEFVNGGMPVEAANKVLAGTSYKCKIRSKDEMVSKATNLYKMLVAENFDPAEAIKLTVVYLNNEE